MTSKELDKLKEQIEDFVMIYAASDIDEFEETMVLLTERFVVDYLTKKDLQDLEGSIINPPKV